MQGETLITQEFSEAARRHSLARHLQPVISALDPEELESGFADWVGSIARLTAGEVIAIDGKTLRGTRAVGGKTLVHMVSAWASANHLVLGQRKVEEKSNEITAIPKQGKRSVLAACTWFSGAMMMFG